MRKGAQSMYQPGIVSNKSMAVSKVMGNSSLMQGVNGKSALGSKLVRKVEGHDLGKTAKTNFQQTVNNLKSKPNQKVLQDEYINVIKGLQEEIKYLQYELKLLKDKEILERQGVNELDNFLKDEIPINQNILAMKNKYNATKAKLEQQLSSLNLKKNEAEDVLKTQKGEIERLHDIINAHRKQKDERRNEFKQKLAQIVKEITLAVDQYKAIGDENRRMQQQVKKMNEETSIIQRQIEKEKIEEVRAAEQKLKKTEKFQQNFKANKESMIQTTQKCEELDQLQEVNPLIKLMEDQNSLLRKKIMVNQKQKSTAQNNIAEIELFLKEQERQREIQRQHKQKYVILCQDFRLQAQTLDRQAENMIKDQTVRAKKIMAKQMNNEVAEKEEVYNLLSDRLKNLEQECSNLIQAKKEFTDSLGDQNRLEKELHELIAASQQTISSSRSTADSLSRVTQQILSESMPIQDQLQKCKGRIPMVERDIERKNKTIHYLNKQIDLLKELKGLDLQQLHMISSSETAMQNILDSFIKNWEKIRSQ